MLTINELINVINDFIVTKDVELHSIIMDNILSSKCALKNIIGNSYCIEVNGRVTETLRTCLGF